MVTQRNAKDRILDYWNSKANSLASGISEFMKDMNNVVTNTSLSVPTYSNKSLSNGDNTSALIFGGICILGLVIIGGIVIYSMGNKCG